MAGGLKPIRRVVTGHDDDNVAKVSVVGLGMATQTGVAERMFRALADAGINLVMITTSEIKISVLVARDEANEALRTVHQAFALDKPPAAASPAPARSAASRESARDGNGNAVEVVKQLQGMEDLTISGISLVVAQRVGLCRRTALPGVVRTARPAAGFCNTRGV